MKNIAAMPRSQKLRHMSNPMLVSTIRRLTREYTIYKLKNDGQEPPTAHLLHAAQYEAELRHLTINHPEYIDDRDPSEGS